MTEFSSHQLAGIAGGLKFFFIGSACWALPGIVPAAGPIQDWGYMIADAINAPCTLAAIVFFIIATVKVTGVQRMSS